MIGVTSNRGGAFSNLIGCSELNWYHGHVNCGASSFVGVDSLDKTRFCFSLGHPSFQRLLLLLLIPIHLWPSPNFRHMFSHQRGEQKKLGGGASGDLIGCSELYWDHGCINCGASSFMCDKSLDKMRFCFSLGHPSFQKLLLLLLTPIHHQSLPIFVTSFHINTGKETSKGVVHLAI